MLDIYRYHNNPAQITGHRDRIKILTAKDAYNFLQDEDFSEFSEKQLLEIILKDPRICVNYARHVLGAPFPQGEKIIATDVMASLFYAMHVLRNPFPLGEKIIATSAENSVNYVRYVLHKPFVLAEPAIRKTEWVRVYNKVLHQYGYPPIKEE